MATLKRFAGNQNFTPSTIEAGDIFPLQHSPNASGDVDGKITLANLKEKITEDVTPISTVDASSTHPVNSAAVNAKLTEYQKTLTAGNNVEIVDNTVNVNLANVYRYKGSVATYDDLPTSGVSGGDVYNVEENEMNYAWAEDKSAWDQLGANVAIGKKSVAFDNLTDNCVAAILQTLYPIGSIKITINDVNPGTYITGTTWEKIASGKVLQGADDTHAAGAEIAAGLPNITGSYNFSSGGGISNQAGALKNTTTVQMPGYVGSYTAIPGLVESFNAANGETKLNGTIQNDVYGKSDTVQPPALAVYFWKRVENATETE